MRVAPVKDAGTVDGVAPDATGGDDTAVGAVADGSATDAAGNPLCDPSTGALGEEWACGSITLSTTRRPTDVLLVLDRSGSMNKSIAEDCFCAAYAGDESGRLCNDTSVCTDRWTVAKTAVEKLIAEAPGLAWGLQLFPSQGTQPSCLLYGPWQVTVSPGGGTTARAQIDEVTPGGSSPVDMAMSNAVRHLATLADNNDKAILLVTDGETDCVGGSPAASTTITFEAALDAIAMASSAGYPVYVVGVGPSTDNLNRMAQAGGTDVYHPATSPEELLTDLASISRTVAACTLTLPKAPPAPGNLAVYVDRQLVKQDPIDGWSYGVDTSTIVLDGSYCERLTSASTVTVQVLFGCSSSASLPPCSL
jgi:Mg-chelatase subunit ChlD